jgi:hypothetical protein
MILPLFVEVRFPFARLLNPNFLPDGKELQRINSLCLTPVNNFPNQEFTILPLGQGSTFASSACAAVYDR